VRWLRLLLGPLLAILIPGQALARPVRVRAGRSIAGIELGMTRVQVQRLGHSLSPDGTEWQGRTGGQSGPLLVLFDEADRVVLVSLDLRRSPGALIDGVKLAPRAGLEELLRRLPGCTIKHGSGGRILTCTTRNGVLKAYDTFGRDELTIHLGAG